jgi:hypothetical protein
MAKLIYEKDFNRLLGACYDAEKSYRSYLQRQFGLKDNLSLLDMLKEAFAITASGNNTPYFKQMKELKQELSKDMTEEIYFNISKKFETLFGKNTDRFKRTEDALLRILEARLSGKPAEDIDKTIKSEIAYVMSNYKEWSFLMRGSMDVKNNSGEDNLFKAELINIDSQKMDFLLIDEGNESQFGSYGRGDNRKFNYIANGVPLEYKNRLTPKFHLVEKTQTESAVTSIVTNQVETGEKQWEKIYDNIIIDLTMMAIINKLDEGFPVFVSSDAGTSNKKFMLCSQMLETIQSHKGLKSHVVDVSSYTTNNLETIGLDKVLQIIKEDRDLRAFIENEIHNLEDNPNLTEDEKNTKIEELQKQEAAASIMKKLIGRKTIVTNLFYGK